LQFETSQGKYFMKPYLKKPFTKIRLVEWLKVKALSSSPSTTKKKKISKGKLAVDVQTLCLGRNSM
jgi:hypothetical protein